jgi:hypothetical protein
VCRSIKVLRNQQPAATADDIHAAARQFVRKVSGFHKPSKANEANFEAAINEIAGTVETLLSSLKSPSSKAGSETMLAQVQN